MPACVYIRFETLALQGDMRHLNQSTFIANVCLHPFERCPATGNSRGLSFLICWAGRQARLNKT